MFDDDKYNNHYANLEVLFKTDMGLMEALAVARKHSPQAAKTISNHIFKDTKVPRMGNFHAYKDFLSRHQNDGVHVSGDFNSFGAINKEHGFEAGDEAIVHGMNKIADASRQFGGKAFRIGGDETRLWFPTKERAEGFTNHVKEHLKTAPKIRGSHQISASFGLGWSPEHAETALTRAKDFLGPLVNGKRQKINAPGQEPTVHHSLLHESPHAAWKPATGKFPASHPVDPVVTPGLKLANPLKAKT